MRKRWPWLLAGVLLWAGFMWVGQLRFTPEAAVRTVPWVKGEVLQVQRLPGATAVLIQDGAAYHAYVACRWGLILWRPCGGGGLVLQHPDHPIEETASYNGDGDGRGISMLAGKVHDRRVVSVAWGDLKQAVAADGSFLLARRVEPEEHPHIWREALALSEAGVPIYEWSEATFYDFRPALTDQPAFPDSPGPGTWFVPAPREQGEWSARGSNPGDVARRFVLSGQAECDCEEVSARLIKAEEGKQTYLVELKGLKDDSIQTMLYLVALEQTGEQWQITGASFRTECRRGVSPEGLCS